MKKQGTLENQVKKVYLGIGSNIGNKKLNINKAKFFLSDKQNQIISSSNIYETESWPNKKFPKFFNIVIKINTTLNPVDLFKKIKFIEKKIGRKKTLKNYPRICDIDILDFNGEKIKKIVDNDELIIPHPRLHIRNFVILPLFEIAKNWKHPNNKQNISKLLSNINNNELRTVKII